MPLENSSSENEKPTIWRSFQKIWESFTGLFSREKGEILDQTAAELAKLKRQIEIAKRNSRAQWVKENTTQIVQATLSSPEQSKESIKLMGILNDTPTLQFIMRVAQDFGVSPEHLVAIITRESAGEINPHKKNKKDTIPKEPSSKGFMQLTEAAFNDISPTDKGGRGIWEYLDNFQKISPEVLTALRGKHPEFVRIIESIQKLKPSDRQQYAQYAKKIENLVTTATKAGHYEPNFIIGTLYLDAISDRTKRLGIGTDAKSKHKIQEAVKPLESINLKRINYYLTEQKFKPISAETLSRYISEIQKNPTELSQFLTSYNYNGDKTLDYNAIQHRVYYGIVVYISTQQFAATGQLTQFRAPKK